MFRNTTIYLRYDVNEKNFIQRDRNIDFNKKPKMIPFEKSVTGFEDIEVL